MRSRLIVVSGVLNSGDAGNDGTTTPTSDAAGDGSSRWSSTVTRISGTIAAGEKLALEVPAAPGRTFKPKATELETARATSSRWSTTRGPSSIATARG